MPRFSKNIGPFPKTLLDFLLVIFDLFQLSEKTSTFCNKSQNIWTFWKYFRLFPKRISTFSTLDLNAISLPYDKQKYILKIMINFNNGILLLVSILSTINYKFKFALLKSGDAPKLMRYLRTYRENHFANHFRLKKLLRSQFLSPE